MVLFSRYTFTPDFESPEFFTRVALYTSGFGAARQKNTSNSSNKKIAPVYKSGLMYQSKYYSTSYSIVGEESVAAETAAVKAEFAGRIARSVGRKSTLETLRNKN